MLAGEVEARESGKSNVTVGCSGGFFGGFSQPRESRQGKGCSPRAFWALGLCKEVLC